jgi:hypothetical protein
MTKYNYVRCRALGHSWEQIPSTRRPSWGFLMTLRCVGGCGTIREDVIDANGDLSTRRYLKPDDYSFDTNLNRADWRKRLHRQNRSLFSKGTTQ